MNVVVGLAHLTQAVLILVLAKPASFSAELDGTILGRLSPTVDLGGRRHGPQPAAPTVLRQRRRAGTLRADGETRAPASGLASWRSSAANASMRSGASKPRLRLPIVVCLSTPQAWR